MIFKIIVFILLHYLRGNITDSTDSIIDSTMFLEDE